MWYVIQTVTGEEKEIISLVEKVVHKDVLEKCFVPTRKLRKKYRGEWQTVTDRLFPGYIFVISDKPNELRQELKAIQRLTVMLGSCEEYFTPLKDSEVRLVKSLTDEKTGEADISAITICEGGKVKIISGPLANMEGNIKKINLHRRIAEVETEFMGRSMTLYMGIEFLENMQQL